MELNREQIVKAFECCASEAQDSCKECPLKTTRDVKFCVAYLIREGHNLIRELTESLDRVQKQCGEIITECDERDAERLKQVAKLENEARQTRRDIDGLRHYLRLNEDIAIQHKREGRPETEEYWKGKLAAFAQIEGYIRHEIDRVKEETDE